MHTHVVRAVGKSKQRHRMVKSVPLLCDVLQRFDRPCLNCFKGNKKGPIVNSFGFFPFLS